MSKLADCVGILETVMNGISNESSLTLDDRGKIV
ncbi:MAG: hypothetical protein JWM44_3811, partial [Bacilli bacterium]|nr:hypothetical protein [Bacilli bacterium]